MKVDKLVIECHLKYYETISDPVSKKVLSEAIEDMKSPNHNPRFLVVNLSSRTGVDRKVICKILREASKFKDRMIQPYNIAETIDEL